LRRSSRDACNAEAPLKSFLAIASSTSACIFPISFSRSARDSIPSIATPCFSSSASASPPSSSAPSASFAIAYFAFASSNAVWEDAAPAKSRFFTASARFASAVFTASFNSSCVGRSFRCAIRASSSSCKGPASVYDLRFRASSRLLWHFSISPSSFLRVIGSLSSKALLISSIFASSFAAFLKSFAFTASSNFGFSVSSRSLISWYVISQYGSRIFRALWMATRRLCSDCTVITDFRSALYL